MIFIIVCLFVFCTTYKILRSKVFNLDDDTADIIFIIIFCHLISGFITGVIMFTLTIIVGATILSHYSVGYYEIVNVVNESEELDPRKQLVFKANCNIRSDKLSNINMFVKNFKNEKYTVDVRGNMDYNCIFKSKRSMPYAVLYHDQTNYMNILHIFGDDIITINKLVVPDNIVVQFNGIR